MPTLFKPMDTNTIGYVKMYSTFRDKTSENCFAFVLMPYSPQSQRASLQSIQFDFNAQGDIPVLSIFYDGREEDIQRKAQETISALDKLKAKYGRGKEYCVFNKHNSSLKLGFILAKDALAYLGAVFDVLKPLYYIKEELAADLKEQLINRDYLAKEFRRLGGKGVGEKPSCLVM